MLTVVHVLVGLSVISLEVILVNSSC